MCSKLWLAAFAASLNGGLLHGFQLGSFNIIQNLVYQWYYDLKTDRDPEYVSDLNTMGPVIMASFPIGGLVGGLLIGVLAEFFGRKWAIVFSSVISSLGVVMMSLAETYLSYEILIVGKFTIGISIGLGSGVIPMYLIEISHDDYRGATGSVYGIMVSFGFLLSIVMTFEEVFGKQGVWHFAIGICIFPLILQVFLLLLCKESPKFSYFNKEDEDAAEDTVGWLRNTNDIDDEMDELLEELNALADVGPITFSRMFTDQTIRSPLIISTVVMVGHQFCGVNTVLSYSFEMIREQHFSVLTTKYCVLAMAIQYVVITIFSAVLVEWMGRKIAILLSFGGMTLVTFCITIISFLAKLDPHEVYSTRYIILTFYFLYVLAFAVGAGTIPWFLNSEINNHSARPMATTIAVTCGWFASFVFYMTFSSLAFGMGNVVYFFYFLANFTMTIFLMLTMRETLDETSVDIIEMFYD